MLKKELRKRIIAIGTAGALAAGMLTGCGSGTDESAEKSEATTTAETEEKSETTETEKSAETDDTNEKVKLTALINTNNPATRDPSTFAVIQRLEEEANVEIEWEVVRSGWDDRKTLTLAGGDMPDMFFGNRTISMSDITSNKELFMDITPYLDECENIKKMFEDEPAMKNMVEYEDGSIYALPSRMGLRPKTMTTAFINKTWLDKLGLEVPETLDEFTEVLRAFKTEDPNGNGVADEIPFTTFGTYQAMNALWGLFGTFGVTDEEINGTFVQIEDGEVVFAPATEGYKEAIKYFSELYKEGLIDPECFTQDSMQFVAKLTNTEEETVGVSGYWTINSGVGNTNEKDYVVLPPLQDENGERHWRSNPVGLSMIQNSWCMSASCKNPEAAMRFMNLLYDPENSVELYLGSYGEGIEKGENGEILLNEPPTDDISYNDWLWEISLGDMGPYYVSKEIEERIQPNDSFIGKLSESEVYEPYTQSEDEIYPIMLYSAEDSDAMGIYTTDVNNIVFEKLAHWICGEGDVESEWDAYIQSLDNVGLQELMKIYDKYWKASRS